MEDTCFSVDTIQHLQDMIDLAKKENIKVIFYLEYLLLLLIAMTVVVLIRGVGSYLPFLF